ncbi:DUF3291 domain-containing protein [Streptomonospora sp. PA3]|uniref:DUF3291 domain-containing protein n=1 Tax=Streptomonospora sp. PA3 TaxID=2607326 RepID=UPI0012DE76AB|nr:DUF3291 domain-containing protein [Streptomonospora sp. PA3]MUL40364.1 DUF3291 domain-containing protein [Streptomonospora sp. PA3]
MSDHWLAQLNVGVLKAPLDDPSMAEFASLLDPVNALAESSPGFVWRYTDEGSNDATAARPFGGDILVNFSVWRDRESLWNFTYRSDHLDLLRRRRTWFTRMSDMHLAMWWIPAGHIPTLDEARRRLERLRADGPTAAAFTFTTSFPPPEAAGAPEPAAPPRH